MCWSPARRAAANPPLLACIIDAINTTRDVHIITLEDPIEYLHRHKKSVVSQREVSTDTDSYEVALRRRCARRRM